MANLVRRRVAAKAGKARPIAPDLSPSFLQQNCEPELHRSLHGRQDHRNQGSPALESGTGWAYEKLKRKTGDWATAGAAVVMRMRGGVVDSMRIALTNVGPTALRANDGLFSRLIKRANRKIALTHGIDANIAHGWRKSTRKARSCRHDYHLSERIRGSQRSLLRW
jgi:hypothetical protein